MTEATMSDTEAVPRRRIVSWALWDVGSAGFNTIVVTFVFSAYLASRSFVDRGVVARGDALGASTAAKDSLTAALAHNASVVFTFLTVAGVLIALLAPLLGQRSDGTGKRKRVLAIATGVVVAAMVCMVFVAPAPPYLVLGAVLIAIGSVVIEFANVNYNAMLVQVSTPKNVGRVSSWGWSAGYFGGIVLLVLLLVLFIQSFGVDGRAGVLELDSTIPGGLWTIRFAILAAAAWFALFAVPLFFAVPEIPATLSTGERLSILDSYRRIVRTIRQLYRKNPQVLLFLAAAAVYRDGIAAVFTSGSVIASQVFGFSTTELLYFGVAANLVAGTGAFLAGRFDDRLGAKRIIVVCLVGLIAAAVAILFVGDAKAGFWACGLFLSLFVGPAQSSSRSFLARVTPPGREGEIFGLYATTGRAVSFLAPALFALFVGVTGNTRFGAIGIALVLAIGLALMVRVEPKQRAID